MRIYSRQMLDRNSGFAYYDVCANPRRQRANAEYAPLEGFAGIRMNSTKPATTGKRNGKVRMIDIARQAGVSRPTVSQVLSGKYRAARVSEKTAEKIRRLAKRLNFHPNHAAQQLAGKRSGIAAVLARVWMDETHIRLLAFLTDAARRVGLEVLAGQTDENLPFEQYVEKCLGWNVDGLIYVAMGTTPTGR